ncbi:hypothetical protein RPMA_12960 [Tardiphaga alba]|uniref:PAS domain-containing protein n=1 Tax=Tardiphaga alba TaxID=340268 RepID=A0ABX8A861_9BRAD|nr:hypothetical protein [Tardiphaga alba]QUS39647.1 hypothetical protein RPMA_12960 [Tardiphaga alba]
MSFESSDASVVKSIRQRDLLNCWLRLYAPAQALPRLAAYQPERIDDERADLVNYIVDHNYSPARFIIDSNGTRMASAYGSTGKGRYLDDYLGPILGPVALPAYHACTARRLPVYTISMIDDVNGHLVAYERLLLPFSERGDTVVTHIIASLKTISEDGSFEIRNLMRGHHSVPTPKLSVVIDRNLAHRLPGRLAMGDVIEID